MAGRLNWLLPGLLALSACGDPLRNVERMSEVEGEVAAGVEPAALAPAPEERGNAPGFLGRLFAGGGNARPAVAGTAAATTPGLPSVAPGTVLPYGEIATVCGLTPAQMGQPVGQAAGFTLYDSASNSVALRTHYITGMADGCARQFTAALALFGDPLSHEMVRYLDDGGNRPWSATDRAYEAIKADVCGVAERVPCGNRTERLARELAFVSVYRSFGTNPEWSEVLLYRGDVAAMAFEGG